MNSTTDFDNSETQSATNARMIGLLLVTIGATIFLWWGSSMAFTSPHGMCDFETVYNHARVVIEKGDPYLESRAVYSRMNNEDYLDQRSTSVYGLPVMICVYPPTSLFVVAPLAYLHWEQARLLWMIVLSGGLVVSALLIWDVCADYEPVLSGALIGFLLANSETLLFEGNAGGIAVSLCVVAVWCFLRNRLGWVGVCCLALSLAVKPHDAGLVWLYFVFAGGLYRKRALQTVAVTAVVGLAAVLWVSQVSPNWLHEMSVNLTTVVARGQVNDPGPTSGTPLLTNSAINMQTVFSVFWNEPRFYNPVSYLLGGALMIVLLRAMFRLHFSRVNAWLILAAIVPLSMLPIYHRHHDAKILLLSIPACVMLWGKASPHGRLGVLVTLAGLAATGDVPRALLSPLIQSLNLSTATLSGKILTVAVARPAPLALLAMTIFFLWALVRVAPTWLETEESPRSEMDQIESSPGLSA